MFTLPIPDVSDSVERPIILQVVQDLIHHRLVPVTERVEYNPVIKSVKIPGSTVDGTSKNAYLPGESVLYVNAEITYLNNPGNWLYNRHEVRQPVFIDPSLQVGIYPTYDARKIELELVFHSESYNRILEWQRLVRSLTTQGLTRIEHNLDYHYRLNARSYTWLEDIYTLRENQHGYGDTFADWIANSSRNGLSVITAGTAYQLTTKETQVNATGYLSNDMSIVIEEGAAGVYTGKLTYQLTLEIPTAHHHTYPLMIHQQLMDPKYITHPLPGYTNAIVDDALLRVVTSYCRPPTQCLNVNIPLFDRRALTTTPPHYNPVITVLVQIDPTDTILFNLKDMVDVQFSEGMINTVLPKYADKIHLPYLTPFLITLHRDDVLLNKGYIRLTPDLDVVLVSEVDPRGIYRVCISITSTLSMLGNNIFDGLDVDIVNDILKHIQCSHAHTPRSVIPLSERMTPSIYINEVIPKIISLPGGVIRVISELTGSNNLVNAMTVMTSHVEAYKIGTKK